jgi:hypothetical protein
MLTDQEIIDRIESYCVRVEDDLAVPLHRRHLLGDVMVADDEIPTELRQHEKARRRVGVLVAAVVILIVAVGVLGLLQSRPADNRLPRSISPATSSTQEVTTSAAAAAVTTATTTVPQPASTVSVGNIVRPIVDSNLCAPLAANGDGDETGSTFDLHLFAWPTTASSFPIQIIGDPASGPTGPFALLQRYPEQVEISQRSTIKIGDWNVALSVIGNGNGTVLWNIPDGSQGYLRSRGLDRDALIGIISSLTARDPSAAIPGFDYVPAPTVPPTLQLLVEHLNTGVYGRGATYQCHVAATDFDYRISSLDGDPVFQYALVIDRPAPLEVGYQQGTLVVIEGNNDPTAPRVRDVFNADSATWDQLLAHPAA